MRVSQFGSCHLSTAWLGFDADLERGCVLVPEAKLAALRATLQITGVATHLNARFIASLVGKIISKGLALGPMSGSEYCHLQSKSEKK